MSSISNYIPKDIIYELRKASYSGDLYSKFQTRNHEIPWSSEHVLSGFLNFRFYISSLKKSEFVKHFFQIHTFLYVTACIGSLANRVHKYYFTPLFRGLITIVLFEKMLFHWNAFWLNKASCIMEISHLLYWV